MNAGCKKEGKEEEKMRKGKRKEGREVRDGRYIGIYMDKGQNQ